MTVMIFFGCAMLAFGPPLVLFLFTIADDAVKIILLIASAFFWLLSLLLSSLIWLIIRSSTSEPASYLWIGVTFSVLLQEVFRFLVYLVLKKAERGLKKLTEDENHVLLENKNVLAYVAGLGFGLISGAFSLVNLLADSTGPGTVGLHNESQDFFIISSSLTLAFILLHTGWSVLFFRSLDSKKYLGAVYVVASHLLVSLITLLNAQQLYGVTVTVTYLVTIVTVAWALITAGVSARSLKAFVTPSASTVMVSADL